MAFSTGRESSAICAGTLRQSNQHFLRARPHYLSRGLDPVHADGEAAGTDSKFLASHCGDAFRRRLVGISVIPVSARAEAGGAGGRSTIGSDVSTRLISSLGTVAQQRTSKRVLLSQGEFRAGKLGSRFLELTLFHLFLALDAIASPGHGFKALGINFVATIHALAEAAFADAGQGLFDHD